MPTGIFTACRFSETPQGVTLGRRYRNRRARDPFCGSAPNGAERRFVKILHGRMIDCKTCGEILIFHGLLLPVSSPTRAKSTIRTSSHVRPPSLDHDSSKWGEFDAICDQTYRFSSNLPFSVSCTKNSPRPLLNSPTFGSPTLPSLLLAK